MMQREELASMGKHPLRLSREQTDFVHRRTLPFIRKSYHYTIEHILAECYLQGMRDVLDAQSAPEPPNMRAIQAESGRE